jgi:hypothetical protein
MWWLKPVSLLLASRVAITIENMGENGSAITVGLLVFPLPGTTE